MDIFEVIKKPQITEKGGLQKELYNQLCFKVDRRANKVEIRRAVETLFKTKVLQVKTMNIKGRDDEWEETPVKKLIGKRRL